MSLDTDFWQIWWTSPRKKSELELTTKKNQTAWLDTTVSHFLQNYIWPTNFERAVKQKVSALSNRKKGKISRHASGQPNTCTHFLLCVISQREMFDFFPGNNANHLKVAVNIDLIGDIERLGMRSRCIYGTENEKQLFAVTNFRGCMVKQWSHKGTGIHMSVCLIQWSGLGVGYRDVTDLLWHIHVFMSQKFGNYLNSEFTSLVERFFTYSFLCLSIQDGQ